jgi:hypothetical protein
VNERTLLGSVSEVVNCRATVGLPLPVGGFLSLSHNLDELLLI